MQYDIFEFVQYFFLFKQKTAYEIRISDWSSDVCSSDLDDRNRLSGDTLNKVTQSGNAKMVRMGEWKLIYDMMGYGQLYHLPTDPHELNNRFGQPDVAREQAALMAELTMWTIRTQDSLPTGPQNRKYQTKWARPHNWYAPYRRAPAGSAFIP